MPRPKKDGAGPPKTRSRFGCWPCKARKVKCGEEKPTCKNCQRQGETCDYSIRLNWAGRSKSKGEDLMTFSTQSLPNSPSTIVFPSPEVFSGNTTPKASTPVFSASKLSPRQHNRSRSHITNPAPRDGWNVDPLLFANQDVKPTSNQMSAAEGSGISRGMERQSEGGAISGIPGAQYLRNSWHFPSGSMPHSPLLNVPMSADGTTVFSGNPTITDPGSLSRPASGGDSYITTADRSKRIRLNSSMDSTSAPALVQYESPPEGQIIASPTMNAKSPNSRFLAPTPFPGTPQTTGSSASDDQGSRIFWKPGSSRLSPGDDGRRASVPVSSLLIDTPPDQLDTSEKRRITVKESISTFYGYDRGVQDLDIGHNDDDNAIVGSPAISTTATLEGLSNGQTVAMAFEPGGYYSKPVPIKIPNTLLPLPDQLTSNHMNLLYFHHFLNHTARILAPHDCPVNAYRTVLPRMAIHDEDLMNLLLAYSACHRSRLLKHPEPETRIARWVEDVFPRLRTALINPDKISINAIATSIMLVSLEIISPGAFGVDIQWYRYLSMAREMFIAHARNNGPPVFDDEQFFLARWFVYLDVLGALSGPAPSRPLPLDTYFVDDPNEAPDTIDCFFGCTRYCMRLLHQVAELVKDTEPARLDADKQVRADWAPSADVEGRANMLLSALHESRLKVPYTCPHGDLTSPVDESTVDLHEMISTNSLYHWAGVIQLLRRVLNKSQDSREVSEAVQSVLENLETIRDGSPAEACLLFPIFTAACEATDQHQRDRFASRLSDVEEFGMKQVINAKELMEKTWASNMPWESIVNEEFIG
ncbi:hypothetical protein BT63DRAFT_430630 [Microthyrium microscopicum]|uniref:Zn(2)-C6 fungal-type domain-containing protein n=1 Tax=Microthyrium microscopicum TaxID=703497 RepID=A0A6A6TT09_9PEZI|nr:hypothetical protein BT63DRAFT_430630 [Microthyrium microscopicum]